MERFLVLRWMPWRPMKLPSRPQAHSHFGRRFCGLAIAVNYAEPRCIPQFARIFADFCKEASLDVDGDDGNTSTADNLELVFAETALHQMNEPVIRGPACPARQLNELQAIAVGEAADARIDVEHEEAAVIFECIVRRGLAQPGA